MPRMTAEDLIAFLRDAFPQLESPFTIDGVDDTSLRLGLEPKEEHVRPGGSIAGPALMALADTATYLFLASQLGPVTQAVTTSLTIHFLRRPPATRRVVASAQMLQRGKRLAVVEVRILSGEDTVAHATVTYALPEETLAPVPTKVVKVSGQWIAYTDGACFENPGPAGSGWIVIGPDGKQREGYEFLGEGTNNIAELTAVLRAVEWVPKGEPVTIHSDSEYAIGVLTKNWKAKKNPELIQKIRAAITEHGKVKMVHVAAHTGIPLNERADELAGTAVSTRSSKR